MSGSLAALALALVWNLRAAREEPAATAAPGPPPAVDLIAHVAR